MKQGGIIATFLILVLLLCAAAFYIGRKSASPSFSRIDSTLHIISESQNHYTREIIHDKPIQILTKKDSDLIAYNYFSVHAIVDSIGDSLLTVIIIDTISENDLRSRKFSYRLKPIETCTDYVYQNSTPLPRFKLFAGIDLSKSDKYGVGVSLYGLSKRESLYGASYDPFNKYFKVSYAVKLHL